MPNYLLHQTAAGYPIGVYSEKSRYYDPAHQKHEAYGVQVLSSKGYAVDWEDWIDQLSDSTPTPTAQWTVYPHFNASLQQVLDDAQSDTSYD